MAFQYPVEIPGVSNTYFLKEALNAIRKQRGLEELDALDFLNLVREKTQLLKIDKSLLQRPVNEGFSGGEKKRTRSFRWRCWSLSWRFWMKRTLGLDIDALKVVAQGVNSLRSPERAIVVVTHYQRLLNYIVPDQVHVLYKGRIVKSGDKTLALEP